MKYYEIVIRATNTTPSKYSKVDNTEILIDEFRGASNPCRDLPSLIAKARKVAMSMHNNGYTFILGAKGPALTVEIIRR